MTTYEEAGVSRVGAEAHVDSIAQVVTATWDEHVLGGFGGFAAGVELPGGYRRPVLMITTDGVGTKLELARMAGSWDGVGLDLVAMCVDDLAAAGARPIAFVDYVAVGGLSPERDGAIVASVARACETVGCPLLGGETAEHPGVMPPDAVDLAGTAVGIVERGDELRPDRVRSGDLVVGLASPNLRSNGFSLIRSIFADDLHRHLEQLLEPSVAYAPDVLQAVATGAVRSAAHITGGGLPGNLPRALPEGLGAVVDTTAWRPPAVFELVSSRGVDREEMFHTFNMGIGFCLVVDPDRVDEVEATVSRHDPRVLGEVRPGHGVKLN